MGQSRHSDRPTNVGTRVYRTAAQSIVNAALTLVEFDAERYDTHHMHDNVVTPERLICKVAGIYAITASVGFDANATGSRMAEISCSNPSCYIATARTPGVATYYTHLNLSTIFKLAVGDYVRLYVWQDSGGNLNLRAACNSSEFAMQRIG